jgi:hypothetical protein
MLYTIADFPQLQMSLLGEGGLWQMLKKDLLQIVASPYYFNQAKQPELTRTQALSIKPKTL